MENITAWIAANVSGISLSAIKDMAMRNDKVEDATSLAWGVLSFATPEHIRRAVAWGMQTDADIGKYSLPYGLPAMRQAVVKEHLAATGVEIDAEKTRSQ